MRKTIFKIIILFTLAIMVFAPTACSPGGSAEAPTSTPLPTPIVPVKPVYQVKRGDIMQSVTFSGRITPVVQESLFFRTDGRVRNLYFKEGETVKKGDVIADLESLAGMERQQALSQLSIQRAQIQLDMAQLSLKQSIATAYSAFDKTYDVAFKKYDVQLAEIALNEVKINNEDLAVSIADATIASPMDGMVLSTSITAGGEAQAFKEAIIVADTSVEEIAADVPSSSSAKIEQGMQAVISLATRPGIQINGEVRRLPLLATTDSTSTIGVDKTVRISMETKPSELGLETGDIVQVKVILQNKPDVLWLPPQAIRTFEGRKFAVVQDEQGQRRVDVKTGVTNEDQVEIVEGLTEGQVVVSP